MLDRKTKEKIYYSNDQAKLFKKEYYWYIGCGLLIIFISIIITVLISNTGGYSTSNVVQTAPSVGTIESTAQKVKAENILVILEGDKTNTPVQCPATDPNTGATTTISVTVTVQTAGQTKVMGA